MSYCDYLPQDDAYFKLRDLAAESGIQLDWKAGGAGGGGSFGIDTPEGFAGRVRVRNIHTETNEFDWLYKPAVPEPKCSLDFFNELMPDATDRLFKLIEKLRKEQNGGG